MQTADHPVARFIAQRGDTITDPDDLEQLRAYLPYLEWMASLPNASPGTRAYVRRIKGLL